nr:MAG TPA: hypothetical protein [Caudoviricetes sp.]
MRRISVSFASSYCLSVISFILFSFPALAALLGTLSPIYIITYSGEYVKLSAKKSDFCYQKSDVKIVQFYLWLFLIFLNIFCHSFFKNGCYTNSITFGSCFKICDKFFRKLCVNPRIHFFLVSVYDFVGGVGFPFRFLSLLRRDNR